MEQRVLEDFDAESVVAALMAVVSPGLALAVSFEAAMEDIAAVALVDIVQQRDFVLKHSVQLDAAVDLENFAQEDIAVVLLEDIVLADTVQDTVVLADIAQEDSVATAVLV